MKINSNTLTAITVFRDLSEDECLKILQHCRLRNYSRQGVIINQNILPRNIHFIISGKVRVSFVRQSGGEIILWEHQQGDVFNVFNLMNGKSLHTQATALTPAVILSMTIKEFRDLLKFNSKVSYLLNSYTTQLLQILSERIIEFDVLDVNSRIHAELLRLAGDSINNVNSVTLKQAPTHAEIASRISSRREAVTRELNELESRGLIKRKGRIITLCDIDKIREMIAENFV